jgi:hypothetical protein
MAKHESLTAAVSAMQGELPVVEKVNSVNAGARKYKYADLTLLTEKVMPLLSKHGLAFIALPNIADGVFGLSYELRHESGDSVAGHYPLPNTAPQEIGSAITYARRYALAAVTGVAPGGDDDDAQKAQDARPRHASTVVAEAPAVTAIIPPGYLLKVTKADSLDVLSALWSESVAGGFSAAVTEAVTARKKALS